MRPADLVSILREDLKRFAEPARICDACRAPLFDADDFLTDGDGDNAGCWPTMQPDGAKGKPCYSYRLQPCDLPTARRPELPPKGAEPFQPHHPKHQRARPKTGAEKYVTPEIEARLKRLSGRDKKAKG